MKISKHYILYAILIILLIAVNVRVEHTQEEELEWWDIHVGRYTVTYIYDDAEGPVFWLSDDNFTIGRWPEHRPEPVTLGVPLQEA